MVRSGFIMRGTALSVNLAAEMHVTTLINCSPGIIAFGEEMKINESADRGRASMLYFHADCLIRPAWAASRGNLRLTSSR